MEVGDYGVMPTRTQNSSKLHVTRSIG
jgi:hypothetical protein